MNEHPAMQSDSDTVFSVVIADDELLVVEALSGLIDGHPGLWLAGSAADGRTAAELCSRLSPDLVVLDVSMPHGGTDGVRSLRSVSPASVVVCHTAHADRRTCQRLAEAGAAAVFAKGAAIDLAGELHRLMKRHSHAPSAAIGPARAPHPQNLDR